MNSQSTRISIASLALLVLGAAGVFGPFDPAAFAQQSSSGENKSWTGSISSGFKQTVGKLSPGGNAKPPPANTSYKDDPIALSNTTKPGPELYVAIARLYEQAGNAADAAAQYQAALKLKPDHLSALLGYAGLQDRLGNTAEALRLYQRAIKANPKEAAPAYNNLGLCLARHERLDEAVAAMSEAVKSAPKNPLYRNNIAALLVTQGRYRDAYNHLRTVHQEAAAYYNMGILLFNKKQTQAAVQHFALALRADPAMTPAQQWLNYLQQQTAQARRPQQPRAESRPGVNAPDSPRNIVPSEREAPPMPREAPPSQREASRELPPLPPEPPTPRRLPPTETRESELEDAPMPGIYYRRPAGSGTPAPLPPPSGNPAIRPLPRVG